MDSPRISMRGALCTGRSRLKRLIREHSIVKIEIDYLSSSAGMGKDKILGRTGLGLLDHCDLAAFLDDDTGRDLDCKRDVGEVVFEASDERENQQPQLLSARTVFATRCPGESSS